MNDDANVLFSELIEQLNNTPEQVQFKQVMTVIESLYQYQPTQFTNGAVINTAGENEGSCKIFYFAKLNNLSEQQTLHCFGDYYRVDVLENSQGNDHGNIRNFIKTGWSGISFADVALR